MINPEPLRILCVHQGSELYGSDRVFIQSIHAFKRKWPNAHITVHLPQQGALADIIRPLCERLIIGDLFVLRLSRLKPKYWRILLELPRCFRAAWHNVHTHDIVYINTIAVLSYVLLVRASRKQKILHIHEYSDGIIGWFLKQLARWSNASIIVNSQATANAYDGIASHVVWNGTADTAQPRTEMNFKTVKLLLTGRINAWKGHNLAIEALFQLKEEGFKDIHLDIIGDVFDDQKHYYDDIIEKIKTYSLTEHVSFHGFVSDVSSFYKEAHVVLVPSIRPEPFGLVAVEGMMWSLPVIAADHGGLKEIVVHNETGILFQPNNSKALAEAIRKYIVHSSVPIKHGQAGRLRYHELFTEEHYFKRFIQAVDSHDT